MEKDTSNYFNNTNPDMEPSSQSGGGGLEDERNSSTRDKIWTWSIILLVFIALIILVTNIAVGYNNSQNAAEEYASKAKNYLNSLSTTIEKQTDPKEIVSDIRGARKPVIDRSFFGSFNKSYRKAKIDSKNIDDLMENIIKENQYYLNQYSLLSRSSEELEIASSSIKTLNQTTNNTVKQDQLITLSQSCTRLSDVFNKYKRVPDGIQKSTKLLIDNSNSLCAAITNYEDAYSRGENERISNALITINELNGNSQNLIAELNKNIEEYPNNNKEFSKQLKELSSKI